jgi:hypothetical protein
MRQNLSARNMETSIMPERKSRKAICLAYSLETFKGDRLGRSVLRRNHGGEYHDAAECQEEGVARRVHKNAGLGFPFHISQHDEEVCIQSDHKYEMNDHQTAV